MLNLYTKPYCPYCLKVKTRFQELAIQYNEKSIEDENNLQELLQKGGKRQVPYLVDDERGISMYESNDIIQYAESLRS